jgi:hypothetical protein
MIDAIFYQVFSILVAQPTATLGFHSSFFCFLLRLLLLLFCSSTAKPYVKKLTSAVRTRTSATQPPSTCRCNPRFSMLAAVCLSQQLFTFVPLLSHSSLSCEQVNAV